MNSKPFAIIFDFDGVIVDSLPSHLKSWELAYHELYGGTLTADVKNSLIGRSTEAIAKFLANFSGENGTVTALLQCKEKHLVEGCASIPLITGAKECLMYLREAAIPIGIASNSYRPFIAQTLAAHHLSDIIFTGFEDYKMGKPSPEPFLLCAKLLNISFLNHKSIMVLEDSVHGLRAAIQAGMYPVGIATQHIPAELKAAGARLVFNDLVEFMRCMRSE